MGDVLSALGHIVLSEVKWGLQRHVGDGHAKENPAVVRVRLGGRAFWSGDRSVCPDPCTAVVPSEHLGDKRLERTYIFARVSGW